MLTHNDLETFPSSAPLLSRGFARYVEGHLPRQVLPQRNLKVIARFSSSSVRSSYLCLRIRGPLSCVARWRRLALVVSCFGLGVLGSFYHYKDACVDRACAMPLDSDSATCPVALDAALLVARAGPSPATVEFLSLRCLCRSVENRFTAIVGLSAPAVHALEAEFRSRCEAVHRGIQSSPGLLHCGCPSHRSCPR